MNSRWDNGRDMNTRRNRKTSGRRAASPPGLSVIEAGRRCRPYASATWTAGRRIYWVEARDLSQLLGRLSRLAAMKSSRPCGPKRKNATS